MTSVNTTDAALQRFDATTARWGRLTMIAGLLFALAGPAYLVLFSGLDVDQAKIWTAFLAIAGTFGVLWFVEPLTYYPILGQASMYQAFMIGNISNKLLPSALIAQSAIGATPGTRRGELAAVMAISGAAMVPAVPSLLFFGTAIAVIATAVLAWFPRDRSSHIDPVENKIKDPADELTVD